MSTIAAGLAKKLPSYVAFTNNFAPPATNVTSSSFGVAQSVQTAENSGIAASRLLKISSQAGVLPPP